MSPILLATAFAVAGAFLRLLVRWERDQVASARLRSFVIGAALGVIVCGALHTLDYFVPEDSALSYKSGRD
jgi:hypothetical protein